MMLLLQKKLSGIRTHNKVCGNLNAHNKCISLPLLHKHMKRKLMLYHLKSDNMTDDVGPSP